MVGNLCLFSLSLSYFFFSVHVSLKGFVLMRLVFCVAFYIFFSLSVLYSLLYSLFYSLSLSLSILRMFVYSFVHPYLSFFSGESQVWAVV